MASTYSPNLRIELIAVGEQSNTWGGTTNNNLGTLIEQAISGVVSIDVTLGNVTLTALQGATDQSRQMVIIATGTPGVTRTITAPAVNKVYSVVNNSNATLSFIASGGTGVTLVAGAKKYLYCDGANFYDAINAVTVTSGTIDGTTIGATTPTTGKFTTINASGQITSTVAIGTAPLVVTSTTAVANLTASNVTTNANLTGAVTSVGNATSLGSFTSAQLATALTDETGTGANVFATSPTLVTPNLGTPSTLIGTNITGTAAGLTAGTVTTNANLTGAITSGGNATSLGSFTSAQLALAISDETGTGKAVFSVNPSITSATLVTPILGTPQSGDLTNCTFPTLNQNTTGNAATVTNGVYTVGNQTVGGVKTFSSNVLLSDAGFMFSSDGAQDTGISWASDGVMNIRCNASTVGQFNSTGFTGNAATATTLTGTWNQMPAGTRVPFAQAAAPTGWTQDTSDNANNRMLRVVNSTGGGVAGTDNPTFNSTVPSHTHTFTGNALGTHTHSDSGHQHTVNALTTGGGGYWAPGGSGQNNPAQGTTTGYANISYVSAGTPSGSISANGSAANWAPRYIDMIICSKN